MIRITENCRNCGGNQFDETKCLYCGTTYFVKVDREIVKPKNVIGDFALIIRNNTDNEILNVSILDALKNLKSLNNGIAEGIVVEHARLKYSEFLKAVAKGSLEVNGLRLHANSFQQITSVIRLEQSDFHGNPLSEVIAPRLSPHQIASVIDYQRKFKLNGLTRVEIGRMLPSSFIQIDFYSKRNVA